MCNNDVLFIIYIVSSYVVVISFLWLAIRKEVSVFKYFCRHDWKIYRVGSLYRRCSKCNVVQEKRTITRPMASFWPFAVDSITYWRDIDVV